MALHHPDLIVLGSKGSQRANQALETLRLEPNTNPGDIQEECLAQRVALGTTSPTDQYKLLVQATFNNKEVRVIGFQIGPGPWWDPIPIAPVQAPVYNRHVDVLHVIVTDPSSMPTNMYDHVYRHCKTLLLHYWCQDENNVIRSIVETVKHVSHQRNGNYTVRAIIHCRNSHPESTSIHIQKNIEAIIQRMYPEMDELSGLYILWDFGSLHLKLRTDASGEDPLHILKTLASQIPISEHQHLTQRWIVEQNHILIRVIPKALLTNQPGSDTGYSGSRIPCAAGLSRYFPVVDVWITEKIARSCLHVGLSKRPLRIHLCLVSFT
jgi:hypothetical protein